MLPRKKRLLKRVDQAIGPALTRLARASAKSLRSSEDKALVGRPLPQDQVDRILVIRPGGLGDAVLLLPTLAALRQYFGPVRVDVLGEKRNLGIFMIPEPDPAGGRLLSYEGGTLSVFRSLRKENYDLVMDTEQYHHLSTLVGQMIRPRFFCGFDTLGRKRLHTHTAPYSPDRYEPLAFLDLVSTVTGREYSFDPETPFLQVRQEYQDQAGELLKSANIKGRDLAIIAPTGSMPHKLWPTDRYVRVAQGLADMGLFLVAAGGADAKQAGSALARALGPDKLLDMTGRTTLPQIAAICAKAKLFVGPDTGVLHIALGVGAATVSLFGPGNPEKWAPRGPRHRALSSGLDCSPCTRKGQTRPCPNQGACMRAITPEQVLLAAQEVLAS